MKSKTKTELFIASALLVLFAVWTILVSTVDLSPIGPLNSEVGFATLNGAVRDAVGVRVSLYTLTDWLGLVPIGIALGFAALGLVQWIQRRSLKRVDLNLLALGIFYVLIFATFLLFEEIALNYRPVLIDGRLEASYPSSTTLLVLCVLPTAMMQWRARIQSKPLRRITLSAAAIFTAFTVVGRLLSGVHWITDIIGGLLLGAGLVLLYHAIAFSSSNQ